MKMYFHLQNVCRLYNQCCLLPAIAFVWGRKDFEYAISVQWFCVNATFGITKED